MKKTRYFNSLIYTGLIVIFIATPNHLIAQISNEFETYLNERMEQDQIPGLSIALIIPDVGVSFHTFGYEDFEQTHAVDEFTLFEIGSVTKTFTGNLFLMLMTEYDFTGHTPIRELFYKDIEVPVFEEQEITIDHLLTHHSGLPRLPDNLADVSDSDPYKDYTIDQLLDFLTDHTLRRAPGDSFEYSNLGYMVLGYLAESITGSTYDELIEYYFTGPLGMSATDRLPDDSFRFATPTAFGQPVQEWNFDHIRGVGELKSNSEDMARYLQAHLEFSDMPLKNIMKKSRQPIVSLNENTLFGTSWMIQTTEADGDTLVHHGGGTGGFRSFVGYSPVSGRGAVVLSNSVANIEDIGLHLLNPSAFHAKELIEETGVSIAQLDRLTGIYTSDLLPPFTITHNGETLYAQLESQPALPYTAVSDTDFINSTVGAELHFEFDSEETAMAFILHQAGQQFRFEQSDEKPESIAEVELSDEELREYTGRFASAVNNLDYSFTLENNQLIAQLTGQPGVPVYPEETDRFFYKVVVAKLHFERDENNEVNAVVLHQGGQQIRFIRDEP